MLARVVRSGVVEAVHDGAVAVVDPDGHLIASSGDVDQPYFVRSAAKPFQARVALDAGASFEPEELAVACASHMGDPIHIAYVEQMLAADGLDATALQCPPAWPLGGEARDRLIASGHSEPRREWHNCSGKHAGMLRACVAAGWPIESYLEPDHPLQLAIRDELSRVFGSDLPDPGIDGCGAPVYLVTTRQLALSYARLATEPAYEPVRSAMSRFGSLTSGVSIYSAPSRYWGVSAKGGAEGCVGLAVRDRFGVAMKSFDGNDRPIGPAMLQVMTDLGAAPTLTEALYRHAFEGSVFGGGAVVGTVQSQVVMS